MVIETASWAVGIAGLVTALAGLVMFLVLTGAITRAVAAEVAGEDPSLEQSYRFGFHRIWSVLLVSVLVGLATVAGLILFVIPGIYIGVRLAVSIEALVVEGRRGHSGHGAVLGAGRWALVARLWHAGGGLAGHRGRQRADHAAVRRHQLVCAGLVAAVATVVTLPYGVLVGVLLYLDLRARKEALTLERLRADLQASAA